MTTMTQKAAIALARTHVSIGGSGTSWTIYSPYDSRDPSGPSTESHADSYLKARLKATSRKAGIALALLGRLDDESSFEVEHEMNEPWGEHDLARLVALAARKYGTGMSAAERADAEEAYQSSIGRT